MQPISFTEGHPLLAERASYDSNHLLDSNLGDRQPGRRCFNMVQALLLVAALALFAALPILVSGFRLPIDLSVTVGTKSAHLWPPFGQLNVPSKRPVTASSSRPSTPDSSATVTTNLVLDVDAGADDAMAILLALGEEKRNPNLKVVAITCVHGNTELDNVLVNVLKTLKTAGRLDIPVYKGTSKSLRLTPPGDEYFGKDGFGDFEYPDPPRVEDYVQKEHAVDALVRLSKEYKGKLTVLCLGPLTNLGMAIRLAPDFVKDVHIAILGGSTEGIGNIKPGVEFNLFLDPEANFIVFNSTLESNPITLVPWETCKERNKITMKWRKEELGKIDKPKIKFMNKAEGKVLTNTAQWVSADPLAAAVVLNPSLINNFVTHNVAAETQGEYARGALFVDYNDVLKEKNTKIIKGIRVLAYQQYLIDILSS